MLFLAPFTCSSSAHRCRMKTAESHDLHKMFTDERANTPCIPLQCRLSCAGMDDEFEDQEAVEVCERCERYQQEIYRLQVALRNPPTGEDAYQALKALNAFVALQQQHQLE